MKKVEFLKNILLTFWFAWFALAGVIITAIIILLTPLQMSLNSIVLTGSMIGVFTGGLTAFMLFLLAWRKYGSSFMKEYKIRKLLKEGF